MPRTASFLVVVVLVLAGCGDDGNDDATDDRASTTQTSQDSQAPEGDVEQFCSGMRDLSDGTVRSPEELAALQDSIEADAPEEIETEVGEFLGATRALSEAMAEAGAPEKEVDVAAVLEGLNPEHRSIIEGMASASQTGDVPEGPAGVVMSFAVQNCGLG